MKVLFVSSGNIKKFGISPIITSQGNSLINNGIQIEYFGIKGKGIYNYLKNIKSLRTYLKQGNVDLIHAHYSYSSFIATLAKSGKPMVVSLMGSDSEVGFLLRSIIKFFNYFFWQSIIVKSERMKKNLSLSDAIVVPNGVNFELFKPLDKDLARKIVGFSGTKKYVIFIADPSRHEKNYDLAKKAVDLLGKKTDVELFVVFGKDGIAHEEIANYINAADVLLLTSLSEGSPNVVKEAMACNCPVVATDVGDVRTLIESTEGCFVCSFDVEDVSEKLYRAMNFGRTNGRKDINYLDSKIVAGRLQKIYENVLSKK